MLLQIIEEQVPLFGLINFVIRVSKNGVSEECTSISRGLELLDDPPISHHLRVFFTHLRFQAVQHFVYAPLS